MNPYMILGAVALWAASLGAAYYKGAEHEKASEEARQAREDKAIAATREAVTQAAAEAIRKIEVRNVQIRQPLETIVRTEKVFVDCRSGEPARSLLNATIASAASAASQGVVP